MHFLSQLKQIKSCTVCFLYFVFYCYMEDLEFNVPQYISGCYIQVQVQEKQRGSDQPRVMQIM